MKPFPDYSKIITQPVSFKELSTHSVEVDLLRLDLLHPEISGNKWFKLKYNIEEAKKGNKDTILTFGGKWSNHIAATAAVCNLFGIRSIGFIRNTAVVSNHSHKEKDFFSHAENAGTGMITPTLSDARIHGMQLFFLSPEQYKKKEELRFLNKLKKEFHDPFIIPEGGNNESGIKGCREILSFCKKERYTHIVCPVGTGATLRGMIESCLPNQSVLGFAPFRNAGEQTGKIREHLSFNVKYPSWQIITDYHFGGFGQKTDELAEFMDEFFDRNQIELDFVYTAKMMFGLNALIRKKYFPTGSKILAIHTGGLQGNRSLELNYILKKELCS